MENVMEQANEMLTEVEEEIITDVVKHEGHSSLGVTAALLIGSGVTVAVIVGGKKLKKIWAERKAEKEDSVLVDAEVVNTKSAEEVPED